ncbi:hypothetical protein GCM10007161_05450 [Ignatzschineria indica]|uniref:Phage tail protein n=1 Tax=Ignatzschineria indica TaxID=472583 RepID=A0A2U2AMT9_9GAMM|nr:phage tail protein [Ignatzschineria indica]PWD84532.1 phage tail protein [Ignatzschineria indica]GGZ77205.1 hypothetical protein GCM10007161_05450 [Ignatzschineria indica]
MPILNNMPNWMIKDSVIAVEIDGLTHDKWQEYDIENSFETPADAFSMRIGIPDGTIVPLINEGATCTVRIDGKLILTGFIDRIEHSLTKFNHSFSINGRDKGAILVDCDAEITSFVGLTLKESIEKIVNPLGIDKIEFKGKEDIAFDKTELEPGMNAWEAVKRLVNSAGMHAWFKADGTLVVGEADYTTPPVAKLILNYSGHLNNVTELIMQQSAANRYSEVTFLGQSHGRKTDSAKHDLKYVHKDETAQFEKKRTIILGNVENQKALEKAAKKWLADVQLEGLTIRATVPGHYTDFGILWENGQRVHLESDVFGIDRVFFLISRRFQSSRSQGRITILELKEDGVWLPDSPGASKARSRKGKKQKKELAVITPTKR